MIILDLECAAEHRFEGWFASQEAFEDQNRAHLICCPSCGSHEIKRLPSAPHLARSTPAAAPDSPDRVKELVAELKKRAENSEDVGRRFPEEARRIHYGDAEERAIRGLANATEARELLEEGISVLPVPPKKEDLH